MGPRGKSKFTRARGAEKSVDAEGTLYDVLHHFSEAIAIVETVALAFGAVLKSQRQSMAISQEQLAERADLDRTTPSLYERGLRQPSISTLIANGAALGCDPCSLLRMTIARLTASRP